MQTAANHGLLGAQGGESAATADEETDRHATEVGGVAGALLQRQQVEQLEANGNLTTYRLKDHRTNKKIDDEVFAFEVPEGVEVLDRRVPELPDE